MRFRTLLLSALLSLTAPFAFAGPGHDHGDEAAPATTAAALPRFHAVSEAFELVGVLNGQHLTLYLDHFADNTPVNNAKVELDVGGMKLTPKPHGDGEFEVELPRALPHGVTPVTATITVGPEADLLVGQIELAEAAEVSEEHRHWQDIVGRVSAGIAALLLLAFAVRRFVVARRHPEGAA